MAQSPPRSALDEFDFAWLFRFGPNAFGHDFGSDGVLVFAGSFWQVGKRTSLRSQVLNAVIDFSSIELVQAGNETLDEVELAVRAEVANEQFADSL